MDIGESDLIKGKGEAYYDGVLKRYDRPREAAKQLAQDYIDAGKGKTTIYYRYTCLHCKSRCGFSAPNILYEIGVCSNCGKETEIEEAGFMSVTQFEPKQKKGAAHARKSKPPSSHS